MAILQALLALISKSAGKILNVLFGWAVRALFGKTSAREKTFLSVLVAGAVAWPLLLAGIAAPKIAAFTLAFVPLPHWIPSWTVRLVWLGLALLVPVSLGLALAAKAPPTAPREASIKRVLRGFPITFGLASSFLIMFVSVPIMRLVALVRREKSADVPLVTDTAAYHVVAALAIGTLNRHGFHMEAAEPGWWVKAPTRILSWFGGDALRAFVPQKLEHYESPDITVSFYPSGVLLSGKGQKMTWAHGLVAEAVVHSDGLQTFAPAAQALEKQIRRVWKVYDEEPAAHAGSARLLGRVGEIARELGRLDVEFDEWQTIYTQILQLERAVRGERQLLDDESSESQGKEGTMIPEETQMTSLAASARAQSEGPRNTPLPYTRPPIGRPAGALSVSELVKQITQEVGHLAKAQIELATTEARADLQAEVKMATGLGVSALAAMLAANALVITGIFALAHLLPAWIAGLVVAGAMLVVAGIAARVGRGKRVRHPLERTRQALKDDVQWTKERLA